MAADSAHGRLNCAAAFAFVPQPGAPPIVLCECLPGWDAASDFFDGRVAVNGTVYAAESCANSQVAVKAIYAVALVSCFVVFLYNLRLLWAEITRMRKLGSSAQLWRRMIKESVSLRISLVETFFSCPLFLASYALKLMPNPPVIGTDPFITVAITLAASSWTVTNADFVHSEFTSLCADFRPSLIRLFYWIGLAQGSVYIIFTMTPILAMLGLNKNLGPIESGQYAFLLARNAGIMAWALSLLVGYGYLLRELKRLTAGHLREEAAVKILGFLELEQKRARFSGFLILVSYVTFSLPVMWTWQAYVLVWFSMLSAVARPARIILHTKEISKHSKGASLIKSSEIAMNNQQVEAMASPVMTPQHSLSSTV